MSRLQAMSRDKLSAENQAVWDRVMSGRTGGGGPYGILIYAPLMAERFSAVENYFRHDGMLDAKDKELVILAAARELGAPFPWSRHEIRGREAGVRPEAIEALRALKSSPHDVYFVFTTQEEVGTRGAGTSAYGVDPDVGIAIDVTPAGDTPNALKMEMALGKGPCIKIQDPSMISDPRVVQWMIRAAEKAKLPYQREVLLLGHHGAELLDQRLDRICISQDTE